METCTSDAQCPTGELCQAHSSLPNEMVGARVDYCRPPCVNDTACSNMQWGTSTLSCDCQLTGTNTGKCMYNGTCLFRRTP